MNHYLTRRIVVVIVCSLPLFLACGCDLNRGEWTSSQASHVPLAPESEPWTSGAVEGRIIEVPHFRIYTTVQDDLLLEKLPIFLETAHKQYTAFLPESGPDEKPLEIYLFNHRLEWETYTRENMGPSAEKYLKITAGGYSYNGISVAYLLERYHTFGILAHEGFHQFADSRLEHRIPAWMEEGLGCNFESHFWRAGRPEFAPDLNEFRLKALRKALTRDSLFPLPEILAMDAGQAVAMPAEKTATFYAQSWALTRFLQEGQNGKYRQAFRLMLSDAADGANLQSKDRAVEIFESYFQDDIETIAPDFVRFASLLADRHVQPGTEVYLIRPGQAEKTAVLTAEQIEQTRPDTIIGPIVPHMPEEPHTPPVPPTMLPEEDILIIRIEEHK